MAPFFISSVLGRAIGGSGALVGSDFSTDWKGGGCGC